MRLATVDTSLREFLATSTSSIERMHLLLCGHGYLGQAVSQRFLDAGWSVSAVSRNRSQLAAASQEFAADISSYDDVRRLSGLLPQPDFMVHCASSGRGDAEAYRSVYLDGCRHLCEAFPGIPLLFTSSTSVYAQTDGSEVTEESTAEPDRATGKVLREAESLVLARGGTVARLSGIYGPGRSVILQRFLAREAAVEEDGRRFLNQIHRSDAAAAILHLANRVPFGGIYNLSDSRPLSQRECYQELSQLFSLPMPPSVPRDLNRKRGWTHKRVHNGKLCASGWQPTFPCFLDAARSVASTLRSV